MPKINPKKNLREKDIEQALAEIYASSEDEGSEDEELSGSFPLYPPYDINQALDSIENITNSDLLEILQKDDSPSPKPFPPAAPPAKKLRLTCESSSPAVLVEALPSAVACQLVSPEVSQQQRTQKLRLTCESSSPAVLVEALPSTVACQLVSPEVSQQQRTQKLRLTCESSSPAVLVEALPSAVACQLVSPEVSQQQRTQKLRLTWESSSPAVLVEALPSAVACQLVSPEVSQQQRTQKLRLTCESSSPAVLVEALPSAVACQLVSPEVSQQPKSFAAAHQPLSSATVAQHSPPPAAQQVSSPAAAQQSSCPAAAHKPSPSETVHQASPPAAAQHPLPSAAVHQPSPSTSAYQPSPSTEAPRLSRSETVHQSSSSTADQSALLQELINKDRNWSNNTTRFPAHDFSRKLKSTKLYNNRSLPIDYFLNMFDNEIFTIIAENTNSYASFMHSLHWSPTDATEIRAYLGLVIMMGLHPLSELELYWSSDPFYHNPIISAVMTCKRFKKLTENLHINDKSTEIPRTQPGYDKLAKIRPVMNILNNSFQNNCIGSHTQAIDESMVKFKGKSVMKQYMPQKPIKRGYKVWARCDSESGYLYQFDVYCGKSETAEDGDGGLGYKVVMKLCREVGPNTLIVFDNFFTSLPLLEMLYFKNIFSVGTVRLNRKGLPPRLLPNKGDKKENKLKVGEFMFQHSDPVSVIKWKDTKDVYVCTTAYDPKAVVTIQGTQKDGQKASMTCPLAIEQYTRYMGGVDRFDHYRSSYSIGRKSTKKNWIRLFWFMLEAACINAYIVYSLTHKKTSSSHRDFRLSLSRSLIDNFTTRVRAPPIYKNKKGGFGVSDELRLNRVGIHMPCEGTRRRCRYCSTREKPQRSKIMCNLCQVPLCPAPCFANFHRYGEM